LMEEYIAGREISAAVIDRPELLVLPLVETKFASHNGNWPIDTYDAKWQPGSQDYRSCELHYPANLAPDIAGRTCNNPKKTYRLLNGHGLVPLDFRPRKNVPYLREQNQTAALKPTSSLTALLPPAGIK